MGTRSRLLLVLLMCVAPPVHAGQGTIRETDDAIVIEYTGEPDAASKGGKDQASQPQQQPDPAQAAAVEQPPQDPRAVQTSRWKNGIKNSGARRGNGQVNEE